LKNKESISEKHIKECQVWILYLIKLIPYATAVEHGECKVLLIV